MAEFKRYTYNGITVQATGRRSSSRDDKKYERTVRYDGNERLVHYGDPNLPMRRNNDEARKNFMSRHSCDTKRDPFAPGFWACYDWANVDENMTDSTYLVDDFVSLLPGQPIRLFPFGQLVKNGKKRVINAELAGQFKLPHFKPPVKLGSHKDTTPAGGFITGLEVREDGLYAHVEMNDEGRRAMANGAYRYHSPEVIWEGGYEDPQTGELIDAPLIVGDALLHSPHLGEAAALYTVTNINPNGGKNSMSDNENVTVPVSWLERLFGGGNQDMAQPETRKPENDNYAAQVQELSAQKQELEAQLHAIREEQERQARDSEYGAKLQQTPLNGDGELLSVLADIDAEKVGVILQRFSALAEQVKAGGDTLTKQIGHSGELVAGDPRTAFNAAIEKVTREKGVDYPTAMREVIANHPELYSAYQRGGVA